MCKNRGLYSKDKGGNDRECRDLFSCCDCGISKEEDYGSNNGCGCMYCWSCNACEECLKDDE